MKRFAFWFVIGLAAISVARGRHRDDGPATAVVFTHAPAARPDPGRDPGQALYRIEGGDPDRWYTLAQLRKKHKRAKIVVVERHEDENGAGEEGRGEAEHSAPPALEVAADLPVPVIPGTRVTLARIDPPVPPVASVPPVSVVPAVPPVPPVPPVAPLGLPTSHRAAPDKVVGRLSATEGRAKADARRQLLDEVRSRVVPAVPADWPVPEPLLDNLVRTSSVRRIDRDYGPLYEAELGVDLSEPALVPIIEAHRHERVLHRLTILAAGLGFVLVCLAALSGYIKADEATQGYYTNRLRMAAAAGVGAGGVLIYQVLTRA